MDGTTPSDPRDTFHHEPDNSGTVAEFRRLEKILVNKTWLGLATTHTSFFCAGSTSFSLQS
jgi:hypothetical protein